MTLQTETTYTFTTTDRYEAECMIKAVEMKGVLDTWYQECIRIYVKYGHDKCGNDLTDEQQNIVNEINMSLIDHFSEID